MKANPPANKAPITHENIIGNPKPPRNPVMAGSTDSIFSIPGSAVILIMITPVMINAAIP